VKQTDDVVVIQGVIGQATRPADPDETGRAKETQLMRHCRLRHADERREVANTPFAVRQGVNQPDTRRIAKQFEDF
jgi:hypothetical protein